MLSTLYALIVLQVTQIPTTKVKYFTTINSTDFNATENQPEMSLQIPTELVRRFEESDGRAVSYLYFNMEHLFPPLEEDK